REPACQPCRDRKPIHDLYTETAGSGDQWVLKAPALRLGDEEIAEHLDARDRLEFFRVDEIRVGRYLPHVAEHLNQPLVPSQQIIGEHRNAEPALARA